MADNDQIQTGNAFGFLLKMRAVYEGDVNRVKYKKWLEERYFDSADDKADFMRRWQGKTLLDAGCGSGFSACLLFDDLLDHVDYTGVDISDAIEVAKERFRECGFNGRFIKDNIQTMNLNKTFDIILCEGVMHHTSHPVETLKNMLKHLADDGILMFYVCKKKAPVREFVDDHIRMKLADLNEKEAWKALIPLTKLGKSLGDLNEVIEIEEDIDLLDIPKGKYTIQRFIYWFFMKVYFDPSFSIDEMNLYNFEWYRPLNCFRFTPEEVEQWLQDYKLKKIRMVVEDSGVTVVAQKITHSQT